MKKSTQNSESPVLAAVRAQLSQLSANDKIGVACSGGRDSMVLLDAARCAGGSPTAIHVNHGLRESALRDQEIVRAYCSRYALPFVLCPSPERPLGASEESARTYRYDSLTRTAKNHGLCEIWLAHHARDNAETVLLHLTRGAGPSGLVGMPAQRGIFARPLLSLSRAEIDRYAHENNIPYGDDETNDDPAYARNLIRSRVLPALESINPGAVDAINRAARLTSEALDALDATLEIPNVERGEISIPLDAFKKPGAKRLVYLSARKLIPTDLGSRPVDAATALVDAPCGSRTELIKGYRAVRDADAVTLCKASDDRAGADAADPRGKQEPWRIPDAPTAAFFGRVNLTPNSFPKLADPPDLAIDPDRVPAGAVWRTRKPGDVILPFGGGARPLKEFFIDKKCPARLRDNLPLLCYNETVLVAVGLEIARGAAITKDSRRSVTIGLNL